MIYVINLDRSPERLEAATAKLNAADAPFERLRGFDARELDLDSSEIREKVDFDYWRKFHYRNVLATEIGCYLSHLAAVEKIAEGDDDLGVVLEDDADVDPDFMDVLEGLRAIPDRWDLVKLFSSHPGFQIKRGKVTDKHDLTSFITRTGRATGYVLSKRAAPKLLDQLRPARLPFDHVFDRHFEHGLKLRGVTPMPIHPRKTPSIIETQRKKSVGFRIIPHKWADPPISQRWRLPFYRSWVELRRVGYSLFWDLPRG